jgi:hypothetical protein
MRLGDVVVQESSEGSVEFGSFVQTRIVLGLIATVRLQVIRPDCNTDKHEYDHSFRLIGLSGLLIWKRSDWLVCTVLYIHVSTWSIRTCLSLSNHNHLYF